MANPELRELWVWRRNWPAAVRTVVVPIGKGIDSIHTTGDFVTFDDSTAQWVLDLRSGGYARLTKESGMRG